MDNPVKPLREQTIREGAHIAKKEATISHPSRGWLGGGSPGGSEVASKVAKKWLLLAFEWLSPMRQKGSKCDASHRNSVPYIANPAVKQNWVAGGGSENAKSGSKGWLRVDRDPSNQGVMLDLSRKSRRFCGLSWLKAASVEAQTVFVHPVKQMGAPRARAISSKWWLHGVAFPKCEASKQGSRHRDGLQTSALSRFGEEQFASKTPIPNSFFSSGTRKPLTSRCVIVLPCDYVIVLRCYCVIVLLCR